MVDEVERLGFDHLWITDSALHARNCYAYLTLAAARSPTGSGAAAARLRVFGFAVPSAMGFGERGRAPGPFDRAIVR